MVKKILLELLVIVVLSLILLPLKMSTIREVEAESKVAFISQEVEQKTDARMSKTEVASLQVDINFATLNELMQIKGVGKVTAQRIIDYRNKNGPFLDTYQLTEIKGIAKAKYNKMKHQVIINQKNLMIYYNDINEQ